MTAARFRYFRGRLSSQFLVPEVKDLNGIRQGSIRLEPRFYLRDAIEIEEEEYAAALENRNSSGRLNWAEGIHLSDNPQKTDALLEPHVYQTGDARVELETPDSVSRAVLATEIYAEFPSGNLHQAYRGWEFLAFKDNQFHGKISGKGWCKVLESDSEEVAMRLESLNGGKARGCMSPILPGGLVPSGCNPLGSVLGGGCLRGGCAQSGCGLLSLLGLLAALLWLFRTCNQDQDAQNQNLRIIHDTIYVKEGQQVKEFTDSTLIRKTDAILLPNVQFYTNSARLLPYSIRPIQELADYLGSHPSVGAIIKGYTDDVGDDEANLKLSQQRADAVRAVLISIGIEPDRIKAVGYGETRPKVRGQSVEARALNRRVEVELVNTESVETRRTEKKPKKGND